MSLSARANILSRLRAGLGKSSPLTKGSDQGSVAHYNWSESEKIEHFIEVISGVKGEVHRVSESNWPEAVQTLLSDRGIDRLLVSEEKQTGKRLIGSTLELIPTTGFDERKDELFFSIPASLTTAQSAIAETGSLVLWPDEQEPRSMSLVPPVHLVLLRAQDIHGTLADVIRAEGWARGMPTNALLISGPSKTADIARILAYGAHGPKELIILLVS